MKIKVGVLASKGGVGKTTISHLLALGFYKKSYDVALCVTDPAREVEIFESSTRPYSIFDTRTQKQFTDTIIFAEEIQSSNLAVIFDGAGNKTEYYEAIVQNTDLIVVPFSSGYIDIMKAADDIKLLRAAGAKTIRLVRSRWTSDELSDVNLSSLVNSTLVNDIKLILDYSVNESGGSDKALRRLTLPHFKFQRASTLDAESLEKAEESLKTAEQHETGFITTHIVNSGKNLVESLLKTI